MVAIVSLELGICVSSLLLLFFSPKASTPPFVFLTSVPPRRRRPGHTPTVHCTSPFQNSAAKIVQKSFGYPSVHQDSQIHNHSSTESQTHRSRPALFLTTIGLPLPLSLSDSTAGLPIAGASVFSPQLITAKPTFSTNLTNRSSYFHLFHSRRFLRPPAEPLLHGQAPSPPDRTHGTPSTRSTPAPSSPLFPGAQPALFFLIAGTPRFSLTGHSSLHRRAAAPVFSSGSTRRCLPLLLRRRHKSDSIPAEPLLDSLAHPRRPASRSTPRGRLRPSSPRRPCHSHSGPPSPPRALPSSPLPPAKPPSSPLLHIRLPQRI